MLSQGCIFGNSAQGNGLFLQWIGRVKLSLAFIRVVPASNGEQKYLSSRAWFNTPSIIPRTT